MMEWNNLVIPNIYQLIVCQAKLGALRSSAVNCPPTQSVGSSKHTRLSINFEVERSAPNADVVPLTINNCTNY